MDPARPFARLLLDEIALRDDTVIAVAARTGIGRSALHNYLNGLRPLPADIRKRVLDDLRARGPFRIAALATAAVIRDWESLLGPSEVGASCLPIEPVPGVDWLTLDLDLPGGVIEDLPLRLAEVGGAAGRVPSWARYRYTDAWEVLGRTIVLWRRGSGRVRFLLPSPSEEACAHFLHVVRTLPVGEVFIKRIDVNLDYEVNPTWLLVTRDLVKQYTSIETGEGCRTYAVGDRTSELFIRVYDQSYKPPVDGRKPPRTRFEIEYKPKTRFSLRDLADLPERRSFDGIAIHNLHAPSLTPYEVVLLQGALAHGPAAFRRCLPSGVESHFDEALRKADAAPLMVHPVAVFVQRWVYMAEWVHMLLHPDDEDPESA